jgi:hypothetical protein
MLMLATLRLRFHGSHRPAVRVVPHFPTNSLVIAGQTAGVELMIDAIRRR